MNKVSNSSGGWLILGGCPRSGTTLLNFLLNTHPEVLLTNEHNLWKLINDLVPVFRREQKVLKDETNHRAKGSKETWSNADVLAATLRYQPSLEPMLKAAYRASFQRAKPDQDRAWYGDKLPTYYRHSLDILCRELGEVHVIHMVRNPHDVIRSMLRRAEHASKGQDSWNGPSTVAEASNEWSIAWNYLAQMQRREEVRCLPLKYESLISNPEKVTGLIGDFLNVSQSEFNTQMILSDSRSNHTSSSQSNYALPAPLRTLADDWKLPLRTLLEQYPKLPVYPAKRRPLHKRAFRWMSSTLSGPS